MPDAIENETDEQKQTREAAEAATALAAANAAASNDNQDGDKPKPGEKPDPYASLRGRDLKPEEVEDLLSRLSAANGEAAARRKKIEELERATEDDAAKAIREAKEEAASETSKKFSGILIKAASISALTTAGATKGHDSLIRLMDTDKIEVDDEGNVTGVDEEIKRIKTEFPALFEGAQEDTSKKRRTPAGSRADGGTRNQASEKKSAGQALADRINNR